MVFRLKQLRYPIARLKAYGTWNQSLLTTQLSATMFQTPSDILTRYPPSAISISFVCKDGCDGSVGLFSCREIQSPRLYRAAP